MTIKSAAPVYGNYVDCPDLDVFTQHDGLIRLSPIRSNGKRTHPWGTIVFDRAGLRELINKLELIDQQLLETRTTVTQLRGIRLDFGAHRYRVLVQAEGNPDFTIELRADREGLAKTNAMVVYPHPLGGKQVTYHVIELED
jgi:hypothetical protein